MHAHNSSVYNFAAERVQSTAVHKINYSTAIRVQDGRWWESYLSRFLWRMLHSVLAGTHNLSSIAFRVRVGWWWESYLNKFPLHMLHVELLPTKLVHATTIRGWHSVENHL